MGNFLMKDFFVLVLWLENSAPMKQSYLSLDVLNIQYIVSVERTEELHL